MRAARALVAAAVALAVAIGASRPEAQRGAVVPDLPALSSAEFAALVRTLSEPGGDFGGDNLISNEQSYLRVLPALERAGVSGGAYLGVGPDQNFSYIGHVRPAMAFIIDIRRDNLLLHLFFKALFALAPTRIEYASLLTGRAPPASPAEWRDAAIEKIVAQIDGTPALAGADARAQQARIDAAIDAAGIPLKEPDRATIRQFHRAFGDAGLSLVFQARGQPLRSYYPSLRDLIRETDGAGRARSFLAAEAAYQAVRALEGRNLVVPVVGDVSGPRAMRAIGAAMAARGLALSAFYISNVEFYLYQDGRFDAWTANLAALPRSPRAAMIRSVFPGGFRGYLPQAVPGSYSTSLVQSLADMLTDVAAGRYRSYSDLVNASAR